MLTTTSVSQDQAFQARTTPVTNLTSSHNTMASPTNTPSGAGTALKRYLIRPRNEPGSTSQFRPLSPFQRPDLKRLRRSISREGDPACQRAQGPRTTGSGWRLNGHCRVWVGSLASATFPLCCESDAHALVAMRKSVVSTSKSAPAKAFVGDIAVFLALVQPEPTSPLVCSTTATQPGFCPPCSPHRLRERASAAPAQPARASERLLASGFEGLFGWCSSLACLENLRLPNAACSVYHALPLLDWLGRAAGAAQVSS